MMNVESRELDLSSGLTAKILKGDALKVLKNIPDNSVQCVITSPPYWALRDYNVAGQLGQEKTPQEFVQNLVEVFREVRRVLKPDGTLWLNIGDTYVGSNQSYGQNVDQLNSLQTSNKGSLHAVKKRPSNHKVPGLKPKDLIGIPWSVALALRNDGWYLRSDIIWHKTNPMPESVDDRPTKSHEYIFLLTKSRHYYYNADAIREPHKEESFERSKHKMNSPRYYELIGKPQAGLVRPLNPLGRNKRTVWTISIKNNRVKHYATFPSDIPNICIQAGTKKGDVVLDPFAGSGTTLLEAIKLERGFIGIEINKQYVDEIIAPRVKEEKEKIRLHKLFSYPGGKWPIRDLVVSRFPQHQTYVDVFGGSAAILLTKEKSDGEVFNDKNKEIANFFRVVKHRVAELAEESRHWIHSRSMWEGMKNSETPYDEIQQAMRFWAVLQDSFGARGAHFGTARESVRSVTHARKYLDEVSDRLSDVHIENLDFSKIIKVYDSPETFFYLDPPYPDTKGGSTNYNLMTEDEWKALHLQLCNIKGKFLLSCNEHPFIVGLFKKFHIERFKVRQTLSKTKNMPMRNEILVSNYSTRNHSSVPMASDKPAMKYKKHRSITREIV